FPTKSTEFIGQRVHIEYIFCMSKCLVSIVINYHNRKTLSKSFNQAINSKFKPTVIIAKTVAGFGVSFMQGTIDWHYWPLDKKQYKHALEEIKYI
ncbi:hypothetical protein ACFL1A_03660, partial [Patescibacteria group bacterium]